MIKDYDIWLKMENIDDDTLNALNSMSKDEIEINFGNDLEFGTAGLRGVIGVGTNKMNIYTVLKSAIAIAKWIKYKNNDNPSIVIGYDVRHMSKDFAHIIAKVMNYFNIKYYLFNHIISTPQLAFSTRFFNADAGVMVTASHNPKAYNGIKIFKKGGSQILNDDANYIEKKSSEINYYEIFDYISNDDLIFVDDNIFDNYYNSINEMSLYKDDYRKIKIVYSPFNGTGLIPVTNVFNRAGYDFLVPDEHKNPDPDFTTIPYPNPEVEETFNIPKDYANKINADIIIATDPDADRMNICVRHNGQYVFLNGNLVGALITYWICIRREELNLNKGVIVKTIVTDDFGKKIAEKFGYDVVETLTGFKNISKVANELESTKKEFIMGYEESIGYEIGMLVRDKDGISASLFIADMADYFIKKNKTLIDVLNELYNMVGYNLSNNFSINFTGINPIKKMSNIMDVIRKKGILGLDIIEKIDYLKSENENLRTNAIIYKMKDAKLAIRPSGTEPKIKIYIYATSDDFYKSKNMTIEIENAVSNIIK